MKNNDINGWAGTVLKVDLTKKEILRESTRNYQPEKFIGGVGLLSKIYWDMGCPGTDAFDPDNPFMISVGPLTGIPGPFNRAEICGIGAQNYPKPQFTYSGFGGRFPAMMKYAGYDAIVVVGKSESPVYLEIIDDKVALKDASNLWGLDLFEAQKSIMEDDSQISVFTIGPAGENLFPSAVIGNESGATAGQGGFGAVMGSKNLKAVAIKGTGVVKIAHPEDFLEVVESCKSQGTWSEGAAQSWGREPLCGGDVGEEMVEKYRTGFSGPYGCPYQCYGFYKMPGVGKGAALCAAWWYGFLDPETEAAKAVWKGNLVAQKLGINHFDVYGLMKLITETIEKGIATVEEWEKAGMPSLPKNIGGAAKDDEFMDKFLNDIAYGKSVFSQGVNKALDQVVSSFDDAEAVKQAIDIEFPAWGYTQHYYGWIGLLLHVALDTRDSGNSTDGYLVFNRGDSVYGLTGETLGKHFGMPYGLSSFAYADGEKEKAVWEGIEHQSKFEMTQQCLRNSLCLCNFASLPDAYFHPEIGMDIQVFQSRVFSAITGHELDKDGIWKAGERIWNLRRAINIKVENRTRDMDTYVDNFFDVVWEDVQDSATTDDGDRLLINRVFVDKSKFEALKDRYFEIAGWDKEKGWPTREKLEELDLQDVADRLDEMR